MSSIRTKRPDRTGPEEAIFRKNKAILLKTGEVCGICGGYVDKSLPPDHPLSASIDHIIPVSKGGRSTMDNLQLTHRACNRQKSDKVGYVVQKKEVRSLPQYFDWSLYQE